MSANIATRLAPGVIMDSLFAEWDAALEIGALLGDSGTADVVDACVAVCARRLNHCPVITSDPEDLGKLDPTLPLIAI